MSSFGDALLVSLLGRETTGKNNKELDPIKAYFRVQKVLKKIQDEGKNKDEEKKKKAEWKLEERAMLWLCFMFGGPIVGMVVVNVMAHLWHDTVNTINSVPH